MLLDLTCFTSCDLGSLKGAEELEARFTSVEEAKQIERALQERHKDRYTSATDGNGTTTGTIAVDRPGTGQTGTFKLSYRDGGLINGRDEPDLAHGSLSLRVDTDARSLPKDSLQPMLMDKDMRDFAQGASIAGADMVTVILTAAALQHAALHRANNGEIGRILSGSSRHTFEIPREKAARPPQEVSATFPTAAR